MSKSSLWVALALAASIAVPAHANVIGDTTGDAVNGLAAFDLTSFSADFDGTNFLLSATVNDAINQAGVEKFVFGIDTGADAPNGATAHGGVNFPQGLVFGPAITVLANGTATLAGGGIASTLLSNFQINGNTISGQIAESLLLPGHGLTPDQFEFSVWTQQPGFTLNGVAITNQDFAPNGAHGITAVPEPATWAMMIVGFAGMGAALRGNRRRKLAAA